MRTNKGSIDVYRQWRYTTEDGVLKVSVSTLTFTKTIVKVHSSVTQPKVEMFDYSNLEYVKDCLNF